MQSITYLLHIVLILRTKWLRILTKIPWDEDKYVRVNLWMKCCVLLACECLIFLPGSFADIHKHWQEESLCFSCGTFSTQWLLLTGVMAFAVQPQYGFNCIFLITNVWWSFIQLAIYASSMWNFCSRLLFQLVLGNTRNLKKVCKKL